MWVVGTHLLKLSALDGRLLFHAELCREGALRGVWCSENLLTLDKAPGGGRLSQYNREGLLLRRWNAAEGAGSGIPGGVLGGCLEYVRGTDTALVSGRPSQSEMETQGVHPREEHKGTLVLEVPLGADAGAESAPLCVAVGMREAGLMTGPAVREGLTGFYCGVHRGILTAYCRHGTPHNKVSLPPHAEHHWILPLSGPPEIPEPPIQNRKFQVNGEWVPKAHGEGIVEEYRSGALYDGGWFHGEYHGSGRLVDAEGVVYDGEWQGGVKTGHGRESSLDGSWYCGNWRDQRRHDQTGDAQEFVAGGTHYDGCWKDGCRHGRGELKLPDGSNYSGDFQAGKRHGYGVFSWQDGDSYAGYWEEDRMHGEGTLQLKDSYQEVPYHGHFHRGAFVKRTETDADLKPSRRIRIKTKQSITHPDAEPLWWELFCRLDHDGDGQVSREELKALLQGDTNVIGKLKLPEDLLEACGSWTDTLAAVFEAIDGDHSGAITWPEMKDYFKGENVAQELPDHLKGWEQQEDAKGRVFWHNTETLERSWKKPAPLPSPKKIRIRKGEVPEKVTEEWVRELFYRLDRNGDGILSREELNALLVEQKKSVVARMPAKYILGGRTNRVVEGALQAAGKAGHDYITWERWVTMWGFGALVE